MKANLALVHDISAPPLTPDSLSDEGGEPRILDVDLAERLGFADVQKIRALIERNAGELQTYGAISATVAENKDPKGRGRPGKAFWLSEGQCLLLCALSRTPRAAAVRKQVIDVFLAYRAGRLVPATPAALTVAPAPAPDMVMVPADVLARIAGALDRLAAAPPSGSRTVAGRDVEELAVLDRFLAAHVRQLPGGRVPAVDLFRTYVAWCRAEPREPLSENRLGRLLRHRLVRLDGSRPAYLDVALGDTARLPAPDPDAPRRGAARREPAAMEPRESGILYGTAAIARHLGLSYLQAKNHVGAGTIPTFKVGRIRCSTPQALDAWIARELQPVQPGEMGRAAR